MGEVNDAQLTSIKTQLAARSKDMVKLRESLININDELEDEGDRVFFGSTNDADAFRAAVKLLDDWAWHDILEHAKGEDLYAEIKLAHDTVTVRNEQIKELNAELDTLRTTLSRQAELLGRAEAALREFAMWDCFQEGGAKILTGDGYTPGVTTPEDIAFDVEYTKNGKVLIWEIDWEDFQRASSTLDAIRDELKGDANGE